MNRLQENRVKIIRAKSSVGLGRKTAISLANSSGRALFLTLTFLSASTVLRAQSTSYTNGEDNTGTIDTTGGISLTITSGAATQSGVISGNGGVTVNPLSTQTGTLSLTATNTYQGDTTISNGTLAVSGTGAALTQTLHINVGQSSGDNGALLISGGAVVNGALIYAGNNSGSTGNVTVTGTGSRFQTTLGDVIAGLNGTGTLTISNGGVVSDYRGYVGAFSGSVGTATVDGPGSTWSNTAYMIVGFQGNGTLTVSNGGTVTGSLVALALVGGQGTVQLNSGGILAASQISAGSGTAALNVNNGILRANTASTDFITGFTGTEINIQGGGGTIDNNGHNITINAPLTGTGSLTFTGTATTIMSGSSSYSGGTTISGGILEATGTNSALGTGTVTVQSGGELFLNNSITLANNITISGTGATSNSGAINSAGTNFTNQTVSGTVSLAGNTLVTNNAANTQLVLNAVNLGSNTLTFGSGGLFVLNGNISGSGGLIIAGLQMRINGGQNSFTGTTDVLSGQLFLQDTTGTAISGNLTIEDGAFVEDHRSNQLSANTVLTINGSGGMSFIASGSGTQIETIAGISGSSTSSLTADNFGAVSNLNLTLAGTGSYSYAGRIADFPIDTATLTLIKAGSGTQILSGTNTYTGGTQLNGGTLAVSADNNLGASTSSLTFSGGKLETTAGFTSSRSVVLNSTGTFQVDTGTLAMTGSITGAGGLTKTGAGQLTLSGSNSYSGGTFINVGTLALGSAGSIATSSGVTLSGTATFDITAGSQTIQDLTGLSGTVNLGSSRLTLGTGNSTTFGGVIFGSGGGITKIGTGSLTLNGTSTYTGDTIIDHGTLAVSGTSAAITSSGATMYVGQNNGDNGTLTVSNGGQVSNGSGYIGYNSGSTGSVTVTGTGSSWTTNELLVGAFGTGTLTISNGGQVSDNYGYIGFFSGSTGTVTVTGTGSSWTNTGNLTVGYFGTGTLTISNGGQVSDNVGYIGDNSGSTGTVTVTGTGSSWTNTGNLYVGESGTGTLTISNGGQVSDDVAFIGDGSGSSGAVTVDGTGSSWSNTSELYVGESGSGTLTISNGGQVSDSYAFIGDNSGSTGTVTVTGTGSSWINNFYLYVGESGTGTLTISNGGQVSDGTALIGDGSGSTGTVTVDGTGSSWTNTSNLFVGEFGTGTLTVSNGGQVSDSSGDIGVGASSTGTVTVDGTGSSWTNTGNLYVGESGTGTLTVSNGGQVSDIFGYIGVGTGSTGTVTVDGTGSSWTNTGNLYVGESGTGTLTVSTSGTVTADVLKLAVLGGAQGTVNLNSGGVLATGQVMAGSGTATFNFNGGILRATGTSNDFISNFTGTEVQLLSGGGTIDNNGFDITVNSPLTGTGSLTSTGTGELILTGSNTYSGGTILQSGTLVIANSSALGTGALTTIDPTVVYTNGVNVANPIIMEADTTLEVDNADSATQTGTISESGTVASVTKIGTGTLTLRGTNSYSGGTEIAAGILQVDAISSGLGTGKVTVDSGATLALFNKASLDNAITISGTGAGGQGAIFGFGGGAAVQESITGTVTLAADATVGNGGLNSDLQLGPIDLQNHTLTIGTGSGNFALNGDITGSGGLTFNAFGSVAITGGNNTFTGLTDVLSGSNLGLADTVGTAISGDLRIQDGGYVQDDNGNQLAGTTTLMLNGSGEFAIAPQGTISLSETIAGLSGTSTSSVVTSIGAGASGPTLNTLTLSGTGTYSYAGQITDDTVDSPSASLALIKSGSGTQILSGNNTYHGGTTIESGTLAISGTGATLGTSGSNITVGLNNGDNGTFVVSAGGHATDGDGTIGGGSGSTGSATVDGTGSTWTNNGLLTVGDQGNGSLTVENGGTVTTGVNGINNVGLLVSGGAVSGTVTVSGTGSSVTVGSGGTGDMVLGNAGPALLVIANGGLVTDNSAFLAEGNSTSSGTVDVTGSGSTWTNNDTITIGEAGTGTVMVENGGSISASTIIIADAAGSAGLLQIGNNNQGGALTVTSIQFGSGTGTIEFDQTDTTTLGANISGAGNLIQKGSGTTILSGNSTFTGGTTIDAGTLVVGSTTALGAGDVTLNNGVLTTTGTGTGIQIAVGGNYTQAAGTTLFLNLYSASNYDSLSLTGTGVASLNGTLHLNLVGGFAPGQGQSFTVLASNETVNGTFSSIVTNLPSIGVRTNYTNDVTVLFQKSFIGLPGLTLTPNQTAVATYIDTFDQHITSPAFANLVGALNTASGTPATLQNAFNQLSPLNFANFASSTAFNNASFTVQGLDGYLANHRGADGTFVGSDGGLDYSGLAVNDPNVDTGLQSVRSRLLAWSPAPSTGLLSDSSSLLPGGMDMKNVTVNNSPTNLWNVFLTGNVILAQDFANNSAGIPYADTTTGAAQIGADYKITPHFLAGVAFGYGHTHANLDTIGSNANVNTYSPAVYLSYSNSGWYANALGSYGFSSYSQNRSVSIGAFNGTAHSSPGGNQIIGDLDGGYDFHKGNWTFGPTLGLQYTHLNVDGYTETGLPGADLTVNSNQADSLRSHLGGRVSYAVKSGTSIFTPHLSASWQHEFMDQSRGITSQFSDVGAGSFVVNTPNSSRDSALADVGVDAQINNTITIFSDYSVQAGQSNYFGQSIQAGLKIGF